MPKLRDRATARAIPLSSRRKPLTTASAALAVDATVTTRAAKDAAVNDACSQSGPDAGLLALLVALERQNNLIEAIEEEGRQLPKGITRASRDQIRRLERALDRHAKTLDRIIATAACTPVGLRVKAKALELATFGTVSSDDSGTLEEIAQYGRGWARLAWSLAFDVLVWTKHLGTSTPAADAPRWEGKKPRVPAVPTGRAVVRGQEWTRANRASAEKARPR